MFRSCAVNRASPCRVFSNRKVISKCSPVLKQSMKNSSNAAMKPSSASLAAKYVSALVLGGSTATLIAGGYAYFDPQFRHDLEELIPPSKDLLASLYGEYTYVPRKTNEVPMEDGTLLKKRKFKIKEDNKGDGNDQVKETIPSKTKSKQTTGDSSVLAVTTLDQSAVSVVDLDISNRSSNAEKQQETKKEPTPIIPTETSRVIEDFVPVQIKEEISHKPKHVDTKLKKDKALETPAVKSIDKVVEKNTSDVPAVKEPTPEKDIPTMSDDDAINKSIPPTISAPVEIEGPDRQSVETLLQTGIIKLQQLGDDAKISQKEAAESIYEYVEKVTTALSPSASDGESIQKWSAASESEHKSQAKMDKAKSTEMKVLEEINNLEQLIHNVRKSGASDVADSASDLCARISLDLAKTRDTIKEAGSHLEIKSDFHDMVNKAEKRYENELAKIGLEMKETEGTEASRPKAVLAYALKKNELLLKELENRKVEEEKRLHELLSSQRLEYEGRLTSQLISQKEVLLRESESKKEKLESDLLTQYEAEIRHQLKRQAAAHRDHVSDVIRVQSEQLNRKYKEESTQLLQDQELDHQQSIAENVSRLKAILASIDLLNDIEYRQRKAQQLMIAVQTLKSTMNEDVKDGRSRTLLPEIIAVKSSSDSSDEVCDSLSTIPTDVSQNGVMTEECLKERFNNVHSVCRHVAMVGEDGGSLWTYGLSYLRSFLTFEVQASDSIIEAINPDEIDTYTVLAKAKYCIKTGDWEQALKFMSLLNGLPRQLASDWIQDTMNYLETKQAVDFLTAYSLSLGVGSIPE